MRDIDQLVVAEVMIPSTGQQLTHLQQLINQSDYPVRRWVSLWV